MSEDRIAAAADALAAAWRTGERILLPSDIVSPASFEEGTQIQDALADRLGFECVGWKLGISSSAGQATMGVDRPMTGRLFRQFLHDSPARFASDTFSSPLVEAEFAFRITKDLPPRDQRYSDDEILAAVGDAVLGIEVADNRYDASPPISPALLAADNGATGAYVVGPAVSGWRDLALDEIEVTLEINGEHGADSLMGEARCKPVPVLLWTANALSERGFGLKEGDLVTTGTVCVPTPGGTGMDVVARFAGLGEARLSIDS